MPSKTLIVADDLTGAQDTAIQLKRLGSRVEVALSKKYLSDNWDSVDIWAIDTETRFLTPTEAYGVVFDYVNILNGRDCFLYKKVDSTLRGNVGAEIEATLRASGKSVAVLASALPRGGRTIVDGCALVHGMPLSETECGRDPFTPVPTSDVRALLATQTGLATGHIPLSVVRSGSPALTDVIRSSAGTRAAPTILVCDGETEADLAALAGVERDDETLFVGSSGLASAFFGDGRLAAPDMPFLIVVGSLNSVSHEQADRFVETNDTLTLTVDPRLAASDPDEARSRARAERHTTPLDRRHVLVRCGREAVTVDDDALEAGRRIADCLSLIARDVLEASPERRLLMTGGELSSRFLKTVSARGIRLVAEAEPGVPYGVIVGGDLDGRLLFSKAGGFGDADILRKIVEREGF